MGMIRNTAMLRFAAVTWGIVALLFLALRFGGLWAVAALVYMTALAYALDRLIGTVEPETAGAEFPDGQALGLSLGITHFPLLLYGVWALSSSPVLTPLDKGLCFFALSFFLGQVSNSNAHELIHKPARATRRLGALVYSSLLFGHHASAHLRVHHIHAATENDPNSARLGEGFYHFFPRAWAGSFIAGYRAEEALAKGRGARAYAGYLSASLLCLALSYSIGGWAGVGVFLALTFYAQLQLMLSDYVQHYGLRRQTDQDRPRPMGQEHSWNAPHAFTSALTLNAPRHSDHHTKPAKPFPALQLDASAMPMLPYSLPIMASCAMIPRLWHRLMDKRVKAWSDSRAN